MYRHVFLINRSWKKWKRISLQIFWFPYCDTWLQRMAGCLDDSSGRQWISSTPLNLISFNESLMGCSLKNILVHPLKSSEKIRKNSKNPKRSKKIWKIRKNQKNPKKLKKSEKFRKIRKNKKNRINSQKSKKFRKIWKKSKKSKEFYFENLKSIHLVWEWTTPRFDL